MSQYVCHGCFGDPALSAFVLDYACEANCDFCGDIQDYCIAAELNDVLGHIKESISREYDDAANHLYYESKEGGYQGITYDAYDLVTEEVPLDLPRDITGHLLNEIVSHLADCVWCDSHPYSLTELQVAEFSWEQFTRIVKHQRRFYFASASLESGTETLSPAELLIRIQHFGNQIGLFRQINTGFTLYRARVNKDSTSWMSPADLGPPPAKDAKQSNRMSPPGIPMFYASEDPQTALMETANAPGDFSVASFVTTRDIFVADFSGLPELPSIYEVVPDSLEVDPRRAQRFLEAIAAEISLPIKRDDRVHVEYVPTQVVTEFIRTQCVGEPFAVDGIRYLSSANPGHTSVVLFASSNDIIDGHQDQDARSADCEESSQWLELSDVVQESVSEEDLVKWTKESVDLRFKG